MGMGRGGMNTKSRPRTCSAPSSSSSLASRPFMRAQASDTRKGSESVTRPTPPHAEASQKAMAGRRG